VATKHIVQDHIHGPAILRSLEQRYPTDRNPEPEFNVKICRPIEAAWMVAVAGKGLREEAFLEARPFARNAGRLLDLAGRLVARWHKALGPE
jgi:hypothetical protein